MEGTTELSKLLGDMIKEIEGTFDQLQQKYSVDPTVLLKNSALNNNINTFSFTTAEKNALIVLTSTLERILRETFSSINEGSGKYLLNFLHQYHYDSNEKKFQRSLTLNDLPSFLNDLKSLQASLGALQAAGDGKIPVVRDFIHEYPQLKNKPGIWGTTLLYSAARNNHFDLVKYLIEGKQCSINAQNQQHVEKALPNLAIKSNDYSVAPTAGSTALHAACFHGHMKIIKYLVDHGADYYITNHAGETPVTNAKPRQDTEKFFLDYLILGYSNQTQTLPERPIVEDEKHLLDDCVWEYKPSGETKWLPFVQAASEELSRALKPQSADQFQEEIYLEVTKGVCSVSTIKFLCAEKTPTWVRCRGSSILNFDCHALWQIMFIKHPSIDPKTPSPLKIFSIPSFTDSSFQLHANAWYNCTRQMNSTFSKTISHRRKILPMALPFLDEELKFNLQTFQFANDGQTIEGFLRWIPKLISKNGLESKKLIPVDNFKPTVGLNPIPRRTIHQKQEEGNEVADDVDGGDLITPANDAAGGKEWSMQGIAEANEAIDKQSVVDEPQPRLEDYLNEKNAVVNPGDLPQETPIANPPNVKVHEQKERGNVQRPVHTVSYDKIKAHFVQQILVPNFHLLLEAIKSSSPTSSASQPVTDGIPIIADIEPSGDHYRLTVVGLEEHHDYFRTILKRVQPLTAAIEAAKKYYQKQLNKHHTTLMETCSKVPSEASFWTSYKKLFSTTIEEKIQEYIDQFHQFFDEQMRSLAKKIIDGSSTEPWKDIKTLTEQYLKDHSFFDQIGSMKSRTFDLFLEQNISYQRVKSEQKPSEKSASVARQMIEKTLEKFRADPAYQGSQLEHIQLIPSVLQQINIYYSSFTLQLPLFESAIDLLEKIEAHTVTTITTSTGSGKSTLLPALLLAEGYEKIIVTQPRRLPCQMVSKRVNETMALNATDKSEIIAGWAVSGDECNPDARILFLTDGLLRERLLHDEDGISMRTLGSKGLVVFLDEVHERSINIDLCLTFLARLLTKQPELQSKLKIIISSATLNASVPNLFRNIKSISLAEFSLPQLGTPYPVTKHLREHANVLDVVQELYKTCSRNEQILCFVNSALDATQYCDLLSTITSGAINARVLIQSQSPRTQYANIEEASVLFSTTIAETSLTFPALRYVIDTGYINLPIHDSKLKRTVLTTVPAAQSTITQRLGRVGRTKPGDYYALYGSEVGKEPFPTAQICLADLTNVEFSLRRSVLKCGLSSLREYLPDQPTQESLDYTVDSLRSLKILEAAPKDQLTDLGTALSKIPDFGSIPMSISVLSALREFDCGYDLICLSSILGVLNTTAVLKSIPSEYKCSEGDFLTLFTLMDAVLAVKQSIPSHQFDLHRICQAKGLTAIRHIIAPAIRRYQQLEQAFNLSPDYREQAHRRSGKWKNIAKALLAGYKQNAFISLKELNGKSHAYARWEDSTDIAVLDFKSTLAKSLKQEPVALVIARDVLYSSAVRERAVLSCVGEVQSKWMKFAVERRVELTEEEEGFLEEKDRVQEVRSRYADQVWSDLTNRTVTLRGPSEVVLKAERDLHREMTDTRKFSLENGHPPKAADENLSRNLAKVSKMPRIFLPMIWRWKSERQVEITVNPAASKSVEITVKGRHSEILKVETDFHSFMSWLSSCVVIRDPDAGLSPLDSPIPSPFFPSGVQPRILLQPIRSQYTGIEERINRITNSKRTRVDLHNGTRGGDATRESRMEVVAWIAVCKFNCKLEGGFVRDWVVGNYTQRPAKLPKPKDWITFPKAGNPPLMNNEVVPSDLDCHLSKDTNFDVDKFQDELYRWGMKCRVYRQSWRYVLLIDEDERTGPFTLELIEPHVALTHDRIDFDVNNLYLEKDFTRELGMRVDVREKPCSIELESIVDNIMKKRFRVLRPEDHTTQERIEKMTKSRGWKQHGEGLSYLPSPDPQHSAALVQLHSSTALYKEIEGKITAIAPGIRIKSIEQIKNQAVEKVYEAMKSAIASDPSVSNPNERYLFHGTRGAAIRGIADSGFDDRYFSTTGRWGRGAYFTDDPRKAHQYALPDPKDSTRVIFYAKVTLGKISKQTAENSSLVAAPIGYQSVRGGQGPYKEYIVYRYGQALPFLKITYQ